jgi:hypothetical protein
MKVAQKIVMSVGLTDLSLGLVLSTSRSYKTARFEHAEEWIREFILVGNLC